MGRRRPSRFGPIVGYVSRQCRVCDRDYLYPHYGGWANCNDCRLDFADRPRSWNRKESPAHK